MKTKITFSLPPGPLQIGIIEADGVLVGPTSQEYLKRIVDDVKPILEPEFVYSDRMQKGVRSLLKSYGFHPSGRSRPASEFLAKDIQARGSFKTINNLVDIINHLSIQSCLPISLLDRAKTGESLCLRIGTEKEVYVFNKEGQELSLKNLLIVAKADGGLTPYGSPVKDSQATKVFESTHQIIGIIYSSPSVVDHKTLAGYLNQFAELLKSEGRASSAAWEILDGPK